MHGFINSGIFERSIEKGKRDKMSPCCSENDEPIHTLSLSI